MFLAWRDLRVGWGRFVLVGLVVALLASLSTLLAGLADGLVDDGVSGLRRLPVDHLAFQEGAERSFGRSTLTPDSLGTFDEVRGVQATPLGMSFLNAKSPRGQSLDLALFGVDPGGYLADLSEASAAGGLPADGVVLSGEYTDRVAVGEQVVISGVDRQLDVVGFTFSGSYGHVPIAYTSLATWQELAYGDDAAGRFSAVALTVEPDVDLAAVDAAAGTETVTKTQAYDGSPGYTAETATMSLIRGFLLVIAALVVGAFFTVWTIQRTRQVGLLKALGASNGYVLRDALGQLAVVLVAAVSGGALAAVGAGRLVDDAVPFLLSLRSVLLSAALLALLSMAGSIAAIGRMTRVDPAGPLGLEA